jgi:hypothetical protein
MASSAELTGTVLTFTQAYEPERSQPGMYLFCRSYFDPVRIVL